MKNHLRGLSFSGRVSMTRFAHGTDDLNRLQNSFLPVLYFEKQGLVCWKKKQNIYERHTPSTLWRCFWNDHTCLSPILKLVASLTSKNKAHIL